MKILSLPVGKDGCSYYRIRKPFDGLNIVEEGCAHVLDIEKDKTVGLPQIMQLADVIFVRQGGEIGYRKITSMSDLDIHAVSVLDIDDAIDYISPLSEFYREYGLSEAEFDGKPLWKDGEEGFDLSANRLRVKSLHVGLQTFNYVTVTTPKLAKYAGKFNKNVYINPNSIDFNVWYRVNHREHKKLRVIWGGSPSHYQDWYTIKKPLAKLFKEYDFDLYMLGSAYMGIFPKKYHNRIKVLPWTPFEAHSYRMNALEPDIAIIPLEANEFNSYKSPIKWLEMSALGIPSVVSNVTPYKEVINTKVAMPYKNASEFYKSMVELLTNRGVRKNIGNAAYQQVFTKHNLENESRRFYDFLCQISPSK